MKKQKKNPVPKAVEVTDIPLTHRALDGLKALKDQLAKTEKVEEEKKRAEEIARKNNPRKGAPAHMPIPRGAAVSTGKVDVWRPDLDKELFNVAMSGVVPLARDERVVDAPTKPLLTRDAAVRHRRAQAEGDDRIAVHWDPSGHCEAARNGRSFALEALGRFSVPEETLDLHGLEPGQAHSRVGEFVRSRRARGMKVVAIVHGQGKHAPDGQCLLRDAVVRALSEPPASRDIDAFRAADYQHGGHGKLMVALRART